MKADQIKIKSQEELAILREAGKILASIVDELTCSLKSGITTAQINDMAETLMADYKVKSAFKGYRGFPGVVCVSINQEIVHGIPGPRVIKDGDIVSLDVGLVHKGYYSDTAISIGLGAIQPEFQELLEVTKEALYRGIAQAKANNHLSDISFAVQEFVESKGFSVVRDFVGHGIGTALHEEPEIPNFGSPHCGPILKKGMVFCIEPMVNMGAWQTKIADDGWTVLTLDGKSSAHFEHMIAVTDQWPEILTQNS